jgi:hypothetical protein
MTKTTKTGGFGPPNNDDDGFFFTDHPQPEPDLPFSTPFRVPFGEDAETAADEAAAAKKKAAAAKKRKAAAKKKAAAANTAADEVDDTSGAAKPAPAPVDPPFVTAAQAVWDGLDERTRIARSLNCLMHGHPAGVTIVRGKSGVFCPHCCTWLAEPGS